MADYDSDSSGDGDIDVQTNVVLGYASKESTEDTFSQIGGLPTWLDEKTAPSGKLGQCRVCRGVTSLLLQLNTDLPDKFPGHERRLYVFGCRRKACRRKDGCIRAIRAGRISLRDTEQAPKTTKFNDDQRQGLANPFDLGGTLFGVKTVPTMQANPFATQPQLSNPFTSPTVAQTAHHDLSDNSEAKKTDKLPETFAEKARLAHTPTEPKPLVSTVSSENDVSWSIDTNPFPSYHLDAGNEYLESDASAPEAHPNARLDLSTDGDGGTVDEKALFESSMDKTFQKFADRLSQNPEQVLRYEFGGEPLLFSRDDKVGEMLDPHVSDSKYSKVRVDYGSSNDLKSSKLPRCQRCGSYRVFELQLTPHMIAELEADDPGLDGMDWGTIIVAVCSSDCQAAEADQVGYTEEWVGIQWEEITPAKAVR